MHNLYIDIGNSFIKVATLEGVSWSLLFRGQTGHAEALYDWLGQRKEDDVVVCSVVQRITGDLENLIPAERLTLISRKLIPGRLIDYRTPRTLGMDRFLPCFGAVQQVPGSVVVIDAGSACTIDYMSADSVYRGGIIMPGLNLIRQSMTRDLPSLPVPDDSLPLVWPGKSTIDSLRWGTTGLFISGIERFLTKFEVEFGPFSLFLTGGDAQAIYHYTASEKIRTDSSIKIRPNLLFEGMQAVMKERLNGNWS